MTSTPAIYRRVDSPLKNKYAVSTGYSYLSQGLLDALIAAEEILNYAFGLWQGSWNPHGPETSAGFHRYANAADLVLPAKQADIDRVIKVLSYIGVAGWVRDKAHGGFTTKHIHCFALFMMNVKYVAGGMIGQQGAYFEHLDGLAGGGHDYHNDLRPGLRKVHFLRLLRSPNATVTQDTHSYDQPGKLRAHQDATRLKGYKITNAVCVVRIWNDAEKAHIDMLVTKGLRFYDLAKVRVA